jgi:Ca2+-binding RTX toxin-like protein
MRRTGMMVALVAVMVAMFATAAYAATIYGTAGNDLLYETAQNDRIEGNGGNDDLYAYEFSGDTDKLYGERGQDYIDGQDGDNFDRVDGGRGYDVCYGDVGDNFFGCNEIR